MSLYRKVLIPTIAGLRVAGAARAQLLPTCETQITPDAARYGDDPQCRDQSDPRQTRGDRGIMEQSGFAKFGHVRQAGGDWELELRRRECVGASGEYCLQSVRRPAAIEGTVDCAATAAPLSSP